MVQKVFCPHCQAENFPSDPVCTNCGAPLIRLEDTTNRASVTETVKSLTLNSVFALLLLVLGVLLVAITLGSLVKFYASSSRIAYSFVEAAVKLIAGTLIILAAIGLFRLRRWCWWSVVILLGLSVLSHVLWLGRILLSEPLVFAFILRHPFERLFPFRFMVGLGGPSVFLVRIVIFHPIWSLVIQAILLGYYLSIRTHFLQQRAATG